MTERMPRTIETHGATFTVSDEERYQEYWTSVVEESWEPETFMVLKGLIEPDSTYVDIGAWIGPTVLYGGQIAARCITAEPDPTAREALEANLDLNSSVAAKTTVSPLCIAADNGPVTLGAPHEEGGGDSESSMLCKDGHSTWEVDGVTLEAFFEQFKIDNCSLLKIDIEGGEALVMPAAVSLLKEQRPHVYLSLHAPLIEEPRSAIEEIVRSLDTYPFLYSNQGRLITAEVLLRDTNLQRFFEIIATDLTPAELGEKLARSSSFQQQATTPQQEELGKIFREAYRRCQSELEQDPTNERWLTIHQALKQITPYLQEPNPELQQKLIGQLRGIVD
ncbi:MAG: FkbM family methyltransferase [Myxococcota bacterium]|nr:FkbM family methyltransferase [Myxococcota bacterium]